MSTPHISIKYLLIGDADTAKIITEFSTIASPAKTKKEANQIFTKVCKAEKKFDERNKITSKDENYFFTVTRPNIIFLILVESTYPERLVFQLIDNINEDKIPLMINDETKELNPQGRQALKALVDKYQDQKNFNKIAEIQSDVDEIKTDMKATISKQLQNMDDVRTLEDKSNSLALNAADYKKNAHELERVTWWKNVKLLIIIGVIVVAVALCIILPIVC